jgi:hypothetical protein
MNIRGPLKTNWHCRFNVGPLELQNGADSRTSDLAWFQVVAKTGSPVQ